MKRAAKILEWLPFSLTFLVLLALVAIANCPTRAAAADPRSAQLEQQLGALEARMQALQVVEGDTTGRPLSTSGGNVNGTIKLCSVPAGKNAITLPNGTAGAPSIGFCSSTGTGIYYGGSSILTVTSAGAAIANFGSGAGISAALNVSYGFYCGGGTSCGNQYPGPVRLTTEQADSSSVIGGISNSTQALVTAGAKLWSYQTLNVEKAFVSKDGFFGQTGATDLTIESALQSGTSAYDSETDLPYFGSTTRWTQLGGGVQWALQYRTLTINPFQAEGSLCPRCTECLGTTLAAMDGQTCTDAAAGTTGIQSNVDFRNFNTAAAANSTSSWVSRTSETRLNKKPHMVWNAYVGAVTSERVWYGVSAVALNGADAPVGNFAAFRFSTNVPDTQWQACTGDGATTTCTSTAVTVTANTVYRLEIDCRVASTCVFKVEKIGTAGLVGRVAKTTNLPTATTAMSIRHYCEALAASARTCGVGPSALETL